MLYNPLHYYYYLIKGWLLQTAELLTWATVNIVTADNNYPPLMQPTVQQTGIWGMSKAFVLSRQVKVRFNCLPTGNFLAEVVTWGSLAWAIICSLWVLAFSLDPAHIFVNTFPSVIPNSKLITISNNDLPKHLSWNSTWTQRVVKGEKETSEELHKSKNGRIIDFFFLLAVILRT